MDLRLMREITSLWESGSHPYDGYKPVEREERLEWLFAR